MKSNLTTKTPSSRRGRNPFLRLFVLQQEVFKYFDGDSSPREAKIIHNKVAKAAKTNHCPSVVETVLSSWPLCPCCEIFCYLVAALPQCELCVFVVNSRFIRVHSRAFFFASCDCNDLSGIIRVTCTPINGEGTARGNYR